MKKAERNTSQFILPLEKEQPEYGKYDIYPVHSIGRGKIFEGIEELVKILPEDGRIIIDGYAGIFFEPLVAEISGNLRKSGKAVPLIHCIDEALLPPDSIAALVSPFTGGNDPVFGRRTTLALPDFFDKNKLSQIKRETGKRYSIVYGTGAALIAENDFIIYIDLPKNEIQFRSRAGVQTNIGTGPVNPKADYKRNYFVDWVVLNRHKEKLLPAINIFADGQRKDLITFIEGDELRKTIKDISLNAFRVRPWFEPGAWGGTWMKDNIPGLNRDVPNYAWSFELISPENGVLIESSGLMLEMSFDMLMMQESANILGDCHSAYGTEFPIRFDYLDTFNGGNLSVQCHPRPEYIKKEFGENFTQEETYYIMDSKDDSVVYLGFTDDIDPARFRDELENSFENSVRVNIEDYVQSHKSKRHDLFLIPYGTIHGSGKNNLVLEISSTPYIFTFKMYDWLRPDLDGKPRPLNISRGMDNLYFERRGESVKKELLCRPVSIDSGSDWHLEHLKTHSTHIYDIHRYKFESRIHISTHNKCHVLNLVEGSSIILETMHGLRMHINYAETFIVPAAAGEYILINESPGPAWVVKAFIK